MRYISIFLFINFCSIPLFSQKTSAINKVNALRYLDKGNQEYNEGRVSSAFMSYKQASVTDPTNYKCLLALASVELELNSYYAALEHAAKAYELAKKKKDGELNFVKASAHHRMGELESALQHYKAAEVGYGKSMSKELEIPTLILQCQFGLEELAKGAKNLRKPLAEELMTKHDEYGPILTLGGKTLFFTARKPETTGNNMNPDDQRFFEDIYQASWNEESKTWVLNEEAIEGVNTEGFDALNYVSEDGMYALGTLNTSASKEKTTASSEIVEYGSGDPGILSSATTINHKDLNTSYFEGAATVSDTVIFEDETTSQWMVFVSDRNGEKSMTDLYMVEKKDDIFQQVQAMPKGINTTGRETTPYLSPDGNTLFFSSDALPGMGGFDIYYCKKENGTWGTPVNLGAEFNTVNDDTHFQWYPSMKKAVLASIAENDESFNYQLFEIDLTGLDLPFLK